MVMRNMCTLVALAVGLRMHFTSVAFAAAALTSSSPCTGPAHALHVCKFISVHCSYACSPCMQVHLLGPCLRTQFVLLCNWDDATAVTEKIKFLRTQQPTWTSRSSKNLYSHKVRKYKTIKLFIGRALARPKESCSRRTEESSSVRPRSG